MHASAATSSDDLCQSKNVLPEACQGEATGETDYIDRIDAESVAGRTVWPASVDRSAAHSHGFQHRVTALALVR
ncbi:hypothetical protein AWB69_08978 [Caballeronia udeis]|uniref:Uncharacterized protein n=1 Tax=Caballeronia udeis TaxID=1232866 RepID=A0A158JWV2_9BURK|nr:hypothetical protein AWB69_08978 [Caballeronia udeis]